MANTIVLVSFPLCSCVYIVCSEYYFSDENLQKDFFLRQQVSEMCVCVDRGMLF